MGGLGLVVGEVAERGVQKPLQKYTFVSLHTYPNYHAVSATH